MESEDLVRLDTLLDAIDTLGDQLAGRKAGDLAFRVGARPDLPSVGLLAEFINQISVDWEDHNRREESRTLKRSLELSSAYEALQAKSDEVLRDIEAARRVQLQLLPEASELAQRESIEFAGVYQSKDRVGGDLYDFVRIGQNSWGFLVADVSGHGVPSALLTMFLKAAFRTRVRWGVASDQVCREVNAVLNPVVRDLGLFVTVFFGVVDLETSVLRYTNCGHPPVLLRRAAGGEVVQLEEKGMILGPFEDVELTEDQVFLEPGDLVISATDGVLEARNFRDELYGVDRMAMALDRAAGLASVEGVLGALRRDLDAFTLGTHPEDDVTLAAFRFHGPVAKPLESDLGEARGRQEKNLVIGLRRRARQAYQERNLPLCLSLLEALALLVQPHSTDHLLRGLALRRLGRRDEACTEARLSLEGLEGATSRALAKRILGDPA